MKKIIWILLVFMIMVSGCTDLSNEAYQTGSKSMPSSNIKKQSDSSLKLIEEKKDVKIYAIDCNSFNSKPELWYIKSGSTIGYYAYVPPKEFNHPEYNIGYEEIEIENQRLSNNESVVPSMYCSFGMGLNQNVNYLYCKQHSFRHTEYSEDGKILSLGFVTVRPIFQVDKTKEKPDTSGKYSPVEESKLISQECTISFAK